MFSQVESRLLRQDFWTSFGKSFPRKWVLYNTKIKGLAFKFHFDTSTALIALDLEGPPEQRRACWEQLLALKGILQREFLPEAVYNDSHRLANGKVISRIYVRLDQKVSIHNKTTWREVMQFFNTKMRLFEAFFEDYQAVITP